MWPFKSKPLLDPDYVEWQFQTYAWLLRNFDGYERFSRTKLITPTPEYFPKTELQGEALVAFIFGQVRTHADMTDWPCSLEPQEEQVPATEIQPGVGLVNHDHAPCGTFSFPAEPGAPAVITYNPAMVTRPMDLVATFAHELGHYLTGTAKEEPPAGWEAWELATDLAAVFLGFGIFSANSAFSFRQFGDVVSQGWQSQRQGYLSESSLAFALAIFVRLTGCPVELPISHLKPNIAKMYQRALTDLQTHSDRLDELRAITGVSRGDA